MLCECTNWIQNFICELNTSILTWLGGRADRNPGVGRDPDGVLAAILTPASRNEGAERNRSNISHLLTCKVNIFSELWRQITFRTCDCRLVHPMHLVHFIVNSKVSSRKESTIKRYQDSYVDVSSLDTLFGSRRKSVKNCTNLLVLPRCCHPWLWPGPGLQSLTFNVQPSRQVKSATGPIGPSVNHQLKYRYFMQDCKPSYERLLLTKLE